MRRLARVCDGGRWSTVAAWHWIGCNCRHCIHTWRMGGALLIFSREICFIRMLICMHTGHVRLLSSKVFEISSFHLCNMAENECFAQDQIWVNIGYLIGVFLLIGWLRLFWVSHMGMYV